MALGEFGPADGQGRAADRSHRAGRNHVEEAGGPLVDPCEDPEFALVVIRDSVGLDLVGLPSQDLALQGHEVGAVEQQPEGQDARTEPAEPPADLVGDAWHVDVGPA